ncbi:MAG: EamA family transporter [Terriglobales bacterium]
MSERTRILAAYAAIYLLWGATFLAIRIGDRTVPPLLLAALRFVIAGALVYGWGWLRGARHPQGREWAGLLLVSFLMFLVGYGILFWAETRVASGVAAVLAAMIPLFVAAIESWGFRLERASAAVFGGCALGLGGVALLVVGGERSAVGGAAVPLWPAVALLGAALAWALATVLVKWLPLPKSAAINSGMQMLLGGAMLAGAAGAAGQLEGVAGLTRPAAFWSLAYLVIAGSVVGFSAYIWLLNRQPAVRVASYALANPVVALGLGWAYAGERLSWTTGAGCAVILLSLGLVLARRGAGGVSGRPVEDALQQ